MKNIDKKVDHWAVFQPNGKYKKFFFKEYGNKATAYGHAIIHREKVWNNKKYIYKRKNRYVVLYPNKKTTKSFSIKKYGEHAYRKAVLHRDMVWKNVKKPNKKRKVSGRIDIHGVYINTTKNKQGEYKYLLYRNDKGEVKISISLQKYSIEEAKELIKKEIENLEIKNM